VDDEALMPAAARGQGEQAEQDTKRNQKTREQREKAQVRKPLHLPQPARGVDRRTRKVSWQRRSRICGGNALGDLKSASVSRKAARKHFRGRRHAYSDLSTGNLVALTGIEPEFED